MAWPLNKILGSFRRWLLGDVPTPDRGSMSVGWGLGLRDDGAKDRAILSNAAPVNVFVFANQGSSTATTDDESAIIISFFFETAEWRTDATEVRLYALGLLFPGGSGDWHVELYDQSNSAVLARFDRTDSAGVPVEIDIDLTADLLTAPRALYSIRAWSDSGDLVVVAQCKIKIT